MDRFATEQARSAAPLLAQLSDAREQALLAGPSRAALKTSDVTTMEGQSELNRLLRGDDENKNVNLVELQKQTATLNALLGEARKNGRPVTLDMH
jgi:hypothetical protein